MAADHLRDQPGYRRYWLAATVSALGNPVTTVALQVLIVTDLQASATELGLVNAARWLPYLAVGLLVGVLLDRLRRRLPVLIVADLARAALVASIPGLFLLGQLDLPRLAAVLVCVGIVSIAADAGTQTFLPRLVTPGALTAGYARIEQSGSVAQTAGPALAGALVRLVGAPLALLVDALTYAVSAILLLTLRSERPAEPPARTRVLTELREGVGFVYRHPTLAPMAFWGHVWFVFNAMIGTVVPVFLLRDLGLSALLLGLVYAAAGVGAVVGGGLAVRAAGRFGLARTVIATSVLSAAAFGLVASAPAGPGGVVLAVAGELAFGLAIGASSPNELAFRQAVTPDRLRGRMNATIKSFNWGMLTVGAPLGGLLADQLGTRPTIAIAAVAMGLTAVALARSPFARVQRLTDC